MKWFVVHKDDILEGVAIACVVGGILLGLFAILHELVK